MNHNEPYHIFKSNVFDVAHGICSWVTMEWIDSQSDRMCLYWRCGESSATAGITIGEFAKGHFSKTYIREIKTPKQLAVSYVTI